MTHTPHTLAGVKRPSLLPTASAAPPAGGFGHRQAFRANAAKRITFNGVTYRSHAELAQAYGVTGATVSAAVRRGRLHKLGTGRHKIDHAVNMQPCAAHGWHWPSQKDAAAAMGVTPQKVCGYLQRGTFAKHVLKRLGVKNA